MKWAEVLEGPSGCPPILPKPICNQRAGTSAARPQLCSALNKQCCYARLCPVCSGTCPEQGSSSDTPPPLAASPPPPEVGSYCGSRHKFIEHPDTRAGAAGVELPDLLPGRPRARCVRFQGSTSDVQHLGTVGRLGEVEGGGTPVLRLWERRVGSEHCRVLGICLSHSPGLWHLPTCMCRMTWGAKEASSRVTVQPPKPPPVMRLP